MEVKCFLCQIGSLIEFPTLVGCWNQKWNLEAYWAIKTNNFSKFTQKPKESFLRTFVCFTKLLQFLKHPQKEVTSDNSCLLKVRARKLLNNKKMCWSGELNSGFSWRQLWFEFTCWSLIQSQKLSPLNLKKVTSRILHAGFSSKSLKVDVRTKNKY